MAKKILVAIADGSEDLETATIIDVLRRAEQNVVVASVQKQQVTCARGIKMVADMTIDECRQDDFDMIVLPGGLPGADNLRDSSILKEMLLKQKQADKYVAAICASPAVVFQSHGLLRGTKATCYPSFTEHLDDQSEAGTKVVVDGCCITSQGPGTAIDFSLKLVEILCDVDKAKAVANAMLVDYR